ncbi:MAG TPA: hypothetical protein VJB97_04745 [Candidatus Paceibacterota bacterium]
MKLRIEPFRRIQERGFTLVETLVAISFLSVAIVAPMTLVSLSLAGAVQARDTITAYNLAQEGIEAVRAIRDGSIIHNARLSQTGTPRDILADIPPDRDFTVDATKPTAAEAFTECSGDCPRLQVDVNDPGLYAYGFCGEDCETKFTRTLRASFVGGSAENEIKLVSTVTWETNTGRPRSFVITANLYRWVNDGSAQAQ